MCSSVKADPGVVFECPLLEGGYGNIRQALLEFLRFVIQSGGE